MTGTVPMASRAEASAIVASTGLRLCGMAEGTDLHTIAVADERVRSVLPTEAIDRAFDPLAYLGSTERFIDRAIASYRSVLPSTNGE
jgi:adenylosuccinate lyase